MDRLAAMQAFVRVAEAGSFTAVADQMNVARSAVTRQIAALEAHLGVKLMVVNNYSNHIQNKEEWFRYPFYTYHSVTTGNLKM